MKTKNIHLNFYHKYIWYIIFPTCSLKPLFRFFFCGLPFGRLHWLGHWWLTASPAPQSDGQRWSLVQGEWKVQLCYQLGFLGSSKSVEIDQRPDEKFRRGFTEAPAAAEGSKNKWQAPFSGTRVGVGQGVMLGDLCTPWEVLSAGIMFGTLLCSWVLAFLYPVVQTLAQLQEMFVPSRT